MSGYHIDLHLKHDKPACPAVLSPMPAPEEENRQSALKTVSRGEAMRDLSRQLVIDALEKSENPAVLKACLAAVIRLGGSRAASAVERLRAHPNPQISMLAERAAAAPDAVEAPSPAASPTVAKRNIDSILDECVRETSASECAVLLALLEGRRLSPSQEARLFEIAKRHRSYQGSDPGVRMNLAAALSGSESQKAIDYLLDIALDRREELLVRRRAIACLGRITSSDAEDALARIARGAREPLLRLEAAQALGEAGITRRNVFRVMQNLLYAPLSSRKILGALALRGTTDRRTCMQLCRLLRSRNPESRDGCADALKGNKDPEIIHRLIQLLLSGSARAACAAARALEGLDQRAVIESLDNRLQLSRLEHEPASRLFARLFRTRSKDEEQIRLRLQCIRTLSLSPQEGATYVLLRSVRDPAPEVAHACVMALAGRALPEVAAVLLLESIAATRDPSILRAAAAAVAEIDAPAAIREVTRRLSDSDSFIAEAAAQALQAIPHPHSVQVLIAGTAGEVPDEPLGSSVRTLEPAAIAACARALAGFALKA